MREQRRKDAVWRFLTYAFVITMVVVMMVPLYWMLVAATLPQEQFLQFPPRLIPGTAFLDNFAALQERLDFVRTIRNSVLIAVVYTLLSLVLCSMAGFAFAKYEFKFKEPIFYTILATLVLPIQLLVIPLVLVDGPAGLDEHLPSDNPPVGGKPHWDIPHAAEHEIDTGCAA